MMLAETEFQTFLDLLPDELATLPANRQLAFALACCERHFQRYIVFTREHLWGNTNTLRVILDTAWTGVINDNPHAPNAASLLTDCLQNIPHSDDFPTAVANLAQNAAIMVAHVAEFLGRNDVMYVVQTATLGRDLVDAEVQITLQLEPSDPDLERKIAEHPLMQAELAAQKGWLAALKDQDKGALLIFKRDIISSS